MAQFRSILFVCWGNVCRSPAAEMILKRELKRRGLDAMPIRSAGVAADTEKCRPSFGMRWAALRRGLWLAPMPRMFRRADCKKYDLVIAMDRQVEFSIRSIAGSEDANIKLISEFLPNDSPIDLPDPMRRSVTRCHLVLNLICCACRRISDEVASYGTTGRSENTC